MRHCCLLVRGFQVLSSAGGAPSNARCSSARIGGALERRAGSGTAFCTARSAARSRPSAGMPMSRSAIGAPWSRGQRRRRARAARIAAVGVTERPRDARHRLRRSRRVVGQRMRQHHGVRLGMRQVEAAAERVAQLVVQAHADVAEHACRTATRHRARRRARRMSSGCRPAAPAARGASAAMPSSAISVHDRIAVVRVQPFGRMRDGVDAAGHAERQRQASASARGRRSRCAAARARRVPVFLRPPSVRP